VGVCRSVVCFVFNINNESVELQEMVLGTDGLTFCSESGAIVESCYF
jgi:hypothetical protein